MENSDTPSDAAKAETVLAIDRRSLLIGLGLAGGAAFSYLNMPKAHAAPIPTERFQSMIPDTVGPWRSRKTAEIVTAAPDEASDKLYQNLETRIYEGKGVPAIMLLIAYSSVQQNDVQVHRPEVCYPASGFPILWTKPVEINLGAKTVDGRQLVAQRGGLNERIIYWVRVGQDYPVGWMEQRWTMALSNASGVTPDGLLFRVSTIEGEPFYSPEILETFLKAFVAASSPQFRKDVLF